MLGKKFDHESIKEPRLLHLTGVAGAQQDFQSAIHYARLEREGVPTGAVLAPCENDRRAGDAVLHVGSDAPQFGYTRMEDEY